MTIETGAETCGRIGKFFVRTADSPGGGKLAAIPVSTDGGVDLGAVGRALGLEPSSVRLNGHFVSRGPDFVSSLTWGSLLDFFACRGLPHGASELDPVVVQGKPSIVPDHLCFKRKMTLEDETPHKKNKFNQDKSSFIRGREGDLDETDSLCIKRKLKLEDDCQKIVDCSSGIKHELFKPLTVVSFGCVNGHGKRSRQHDLVPEFPCKRVR
ncbi:uncharacterized protein LOC122021552 [Zingiber officinale]|uniref:uncharacterized protein LOC122021552 n=1 Tax=Zingiber officinale TaxID=94328 RepID=UPI001C4D568E|nr:uncharacterized protein LOC122021552 [Zingiber officinale]